MTIDGSKITTDHLSRAAYVYLRQSTADQVQHNLESQRLQYALVDRAKALGWGMVELIDDDLGRSAGGVDRPGFRKLLAAVCANQVGLVLSIEASRLARNGRDWHTLLEFCGVVGCLLGDREAVYDPRLPNDRFVLGMQGTLNEMELSMLRQRSWQAQRQKAGRGELFTSVAVGYIRVGRDTIDMDPDQRVRDAIALVFSKFAAFGSIRQVHLWFRQEGITLPVVSHGPADREVIWKLPVYNSVKKLLTNPIYAGAYAYGRTTSRMQIENGRKRVVRGFKREREDWDVLIRDHHDGYITWDEYERNQRMICDNANGTRAARGSVRQGDGLLAGLLRCGHCSRKLQVNYRGKRSARYRCRGGEEEDGTRCISFGALRVDEAVGEAVIRALQPHGVEAALLAIEESDKASCEVILQAERALEEARFQADQARRRYEAVDPDNRLVADNLERLWNTRLEAVQACEQRLSTLQAQSRQEKLTPDERVAYLALGADLERTWRHEAGTSEMRKRILRAALVEIMVTIQDDRIRLLLHWQGGDHMELLVRKNRTGQHRLATDADTEDLIREVARIMPDRLIVALLNRAGKRTGKGNSWTEARLKSFRTNHDIAAYREGEMQERGEIKLAEAAERLSISEKTVRRLIRRGVIPARQACKGAPWVIDANALTDSVLNLEEEAPPAHNSQQKLFDFQ